MEQKKNIHACSSLVLNGIQVPCEGTQEAAPGPPVRCRERQRTLERLSQTGAARCSGPGEFRGMMSTGVPFAAAGA